ncbi:MAG TPA: alpha/beta fold hydrolase [Gemmatimonadales bacterium]|nr:alpha/beta fold hydrolase [Gemmatimonadales bacterium]
MIVSAFLEELRSRKIQVWAEGDQLRCAAPTGVLTPALRDQLRQEKSAIVQFLRSAEALARRERAIVPLQPRGRRVPVFAVPGHNGNVFSFRFLAQQLGEDQPFFGLQPPGVDGECEPLTRVEELATYFAERIRAFRAEGPYIIAGHCAGGTIAFELARRLAEQGAAITFLAVFSSPYPTWFRRAPQLLERLAHQADWLSHHVRTLASLSNRERRLYITAKLAERRRQRRARRDAPEDAPPDPLMIQRTKVEAATLTALRRYIPRHFEGRVALFFPNSAWLRPGNAMLRWREVAGDVEEYCGPDGCEGDVMLHEPHVRMIAEQFQGCVRRMEMKGVPSRRELGSAVSTESGSAPLSWVRGACSSGG